MGALIRGIIIFILILVAIYLLAAIILSLSTTRPEVTDCRKEYQVYITSNGVHLDIILPVKNLGVSFAEQLDLPLQSSYIAFGWGDKEFYINTPTWSDVKMGTLLRALFTNSESAVHVVHINSKHQEWLEITLCQHQLQKLNKFIESTFRNDISGKFMEIDASGYTQWDRFYRASGNFSCFQTCNNWVNSSLKAAQVKTSIWSPFDKGVLYHLKKQNKSPGILN